MDSKASPDSSQLNPNALTGETHMSGQAEKVHEVEAFSTLALIAWSETLLCARGKPSDFSALRAIMRFVSRSSVGTPDIHRLDPSARALFRTAYMRGNDLDQLEDVDTEINKVFLLAAKLLTVDKALMLSSEERSLAAASVATYLSNILGTINRRGRSSDLCVRLGDDARR